MSVSLSRIWGARGSEGIQSGTTEFGSRTLGPRWVLPLVNRPTLSIGAYAKRDRRKDRQTDGRSRTERRLQTDALRLFTVKTRLAA